jgi:hypothetical protein
MTSWFVVLVGFAVSVSFVVATIDDDAPTELCWNAASRAACAVRWARAAPFIDANATGTFALTVDNSTQSLVIRAQLRFLEASAPTYISVVPEVCVVIGLNATVDWNACVWSNLGLVLSLLGSDTFAQSNVVVGLPPSDGNTTLRVGVRLPAAVSRSVDANTMVSIVARPTLDAEAAFDGSLWPLAFGDVILARVRNGTDGGDRRQFSVQLCSSPHDALDYVFANLVQFATSPIKPGDAFATRESSVMLHADLHAETSICAAPCAALLRAPDNGAAALLAVALDAVQSNAADPGPLAVRLSSAAEGHAPHPFRYQAESGVGSLQVVRSGDDLLVARPLEDGVDSAALYIACAAIETLPVFNNMNYYRSACWLQEHLTPVAVVPAAATMFRVRGFFTRCDLRQVAAVVLAAQNQTLATFVYSAKDVASVAVDGDDDDDEAIAWSSPTFGAGIGIGLAVGAVVLVIAIVALRKSMAKTAQYDKI